MRQSTPSIKFKPFLFSYRYDGAEWNIEMMAAWGAFMQIGQERFRLHVVKGELVVSHYGKDKPDV